MSTIANLMVKIGADTSGFQNGMAQVEKRTGILGAGFGKLGMLVAGAFSVQALVRWIASSTKLASGLVEIQNVIDTTFGPQANKINEFASRAKEQFGLSELAAKDFASSIGASMKSSGIATEKLADMSIGLAGLAGDYTSFRNVPIEEMFQKIRSAMVGEIEPMRSLGVNMSVAAIEAFALSRGINESYQKMSEATKVTLRYEYMMKLANDVTGDFQKTQASFANQSRIAQLNWETFSATMGAGFANIAYGVITWFNGISGSIQTVAMNFRLLTAIIFGDSSKQGASTTKAAAGTAVLTEEQWKLQNQVKSTGKAIKGSLSSIDQLNILQRKAAGGGGGGTGGTYADYLKGLEEVKKALDELPLPEEPDWPQWAKDVQEFIDKMNEGRTTIQTVIGWISSFFETVGKGFNGVVTGIENSIIVWGKYYDKIKEMVEKWGQTFDLMKAGIIKAIEAIKIGWNAWLNDPTVKAVLGWIETTFNNIKRAGELAIQAIKIGWNAWLNDPIIKSVLGWIETAFNNIKRAGEFAIQGISGLWTTWLNDPKNAKFKEDWDTFWYNMHYWVGGFKTGWDAIFNPPGGSNIGVFTEIENAFNRSMIAIQQAIPEWMWIAIGVKKPAPFVEPPPPRPSNQGYQYQTPKPPVYVQPKSPSKPAYIPFSTEGWSPSEYAQGTNYVPDTGLALLHKGEAVVPAKFNGGGDSNIESLLRDLISAIKNQGAPSVTVKLGERAFTDMIVESTRGAALQSGRRA